MSTPEVQATSTDAARAGETASVPPTGETAEPRIEEPEPTATAAHPEARASTLEPVAKEEPVTSEPSVEPKEPEQPKQPSTTTTSAEPVPKLNPSATEFISRSSSTGPGEGKPTALAGSRHAGRGARRGARQSGAGGSSRPVQQEQGGGNPVVLAPVKGVDVAAMTGFRGKVVRETRPPRGYVPPAPERKARLTAEELEEKMARMRLVNERTQAEQEARNADAQAYESQVSIERERAAAERERRRAEAEAKSRRTLAVQASIDQQREQYRLRKLKLLEAQGGAVGVEQEEGYGPREPRSEREGYGGYGYGGGRMSGRGGYEQGEQYAGSGRGDHRGRGRGGNRGRPAGGVTPRPVSAAKAQVATVPDTKDAGAFPALDGKTDVGKDVAAKEPDASET